MSTQSTVLNRLAIWEEILEYLSTLEDHARTTSPQAKAIRLRDIHDELLDLSTENFNTLLRAGHVHDDCNTPLADLRKWHWQMRLKESEEHADDRRGRGQIVNTLTIMRKAVREQIYEEVMELECLSEGGALTLKFFERNLRAMAVLRL